MLNKMATLHAIVLVLVVTKVACEPLCSDLDTSACALLIKAKPDFCSTSELAQSTCRRSCGNCPLTCYDCPQHSVLNSSLCTTTRRCASNETCMINTLHAHSDGHTEHIMTCGDKRYCDGLGFGFAVGRREMGSRDLNLKCCHTDLCNVPDFTTTTMKSTGPVTTLGPIHSCQRDIIFLLDESASIGPNAFHKILDFVKAIVIRLDIGIHGDQVGLMVYDFKPHLDWHLNEYTTKSELLSALTYVPYHDGQTRTDLALKFVREEMLQYHNGDRPSAKNVLIVLTDGQSTSHANTTIEAQKLHTQGNLLIALGVGSTSNNKELLDIASDYHHALKVSSYDHLIDAVPIIMSGICD